MQEDTDHASTEYAQSMKNPEALLAWRVLPLPKLGPNRAMITKPSDSPCDPKALPLSLIQTWTPSLAIPAPCILACPRPYELCQRRVHPFTLVKILALSHHERQLASQTPDLPKSKSKNNKYKEMGSN